MHALDEMSGSRKFLHSFRIFFIQNLMQEIACSAWRQCSNWYVLDGV